MAKGKELKRPKYRSGKLIQFKHLEPPINYSKLPLIFSLKYMIYQGNCCISRCEKEEKSLILDTIQRLSQSTWNEIIGWRKEIGFEKMPHHRFKVSLPNVLTPEVSILVTRYDGEGGRLAGFRERDIFHIVLAGKDLYSH